MAQRVAVGEDTGVAGVPYLRTAILWLFILAFIAVYAYLGYEIWTADAGTEPSVSEKLLGAAAALAGTLGTGFALALGIKKNDELRDGSNRTLGSQGNSALLPGIGAGNSWPLTCGVYVYFVVGLAALLTYFVHTDETPATVKGLALAMSGYIVTVASNAFGSITVENA